VTQDLDTVVKHDDSDATGGTGATGESEPSDIWPAPDAPLEVAKKFYADKGCLTDGVRNLLFWRGGWILWTGTGWREVDEAEVTLRLYLALEHAVYTDTEKPGGGVLGLFQAILGGLETPWNPNRAKIGNVMHAMKSIGHLPSNTEPPAWIHAVHSANSPATQVISCQNGVLDLGTRTLHNHSPALFNYASVPFDYDPNAPEPKVWLAFLKSLWGDDKDSISLLQQWFGYTLSGRLEQQKLLALIGPTRSGKGTIVGLITQLMGEDNVANPAMGSLSDKFGLWPLADKPLAIITDAQGNASHAAVENVKRITGEDRVTFDRKHRSHWTGKMPTRFMLVSNLLPQFGDASGVIANRFLVLRMTESWLGREDYELADKLVPELPAVLNWSLEGLDRLNANGKFTVPQSSRESVVEMMDLASPVSAFVREMCVLDANATVTRDDLYAAWRQWCEENGHRVTAKATFGRDLRAVVPGLKQTHPRVKGVQVWGYAGIGLR
jgi:putative DNA primase/helicase